jgi:hypothetical protein
MLHELCAERSEICQARDAQGTRRHNVGSASQHRCFNAQAAPPTQARAFDQTEARRLAPGLQAFD